MVFKITKIGLLGKVVILTNIAIITSNKQPCLLDS